MRKNVRRNYVGHFHGLNSAPTPNPYLKAVFPNVAVFRHKVFMEVIKAK